ncbi:MAG: hypothetical protein J3R72DRAFT_458991 [Linnemannia gamsii]|nr:MAG: hypothetical protein J3R72DRAFT_458991 [Linnemannia gamsii]
MHGDRTTQYSCASLCRGQKSRRQQRSGCATTSLPILPHFSFLFSRPIGIHGHLSPPFATSFWFLFSLLPFLCEILSLICAHQVRVCAHPLTSALLFCCRFSVLFFVYYFLRCRFWLRGTVVTKSVIFP